MKGERKHKKKWRNHSYTAYSEKNLDQISINEGDLDKIEIGSDQLRNEERQARSEVSVKGK